MARYGEGFSRRKRKRKWKAVSLEDPEFFGGDMEGFVSLEVLNSEELEDEAGWKVIKESPGSAETAKSTKPKKKKQKKSGRKDGKDNLNCPEKVDITINTSQLRKTNPTDTELDDMNDSDGDSGGVVDNEWKYLGVHDLIGKQLVKLGFKDPTAIQKEVIPPAIQSRMDIVGAAETGSGKTLAYGVPVLQRLLELKLKQNDPEVWKQKDKNVHDGVRGLILAPTRELALQVHKNMDVIGKVFSVKVACVVGGMSEEKQQRVLKGCPDIVVATPGRLWHLIEQGEPHLTQMTNLQSLVVDEADRMVQEGHYQELTFLMERINNIPEKTLSKLQKFVFSATLTSSSTSKKNKKNSFDTLIKKVGLKQKAKVIDLTRKEMTVESLTESKLLCSVEDKDMYLYYFLQRYPNRTLVFVNTIDTLRRLSAILTLLRLSPLPLHAGMQQRQRLKNLDRFKSRTDGLLLASDVAARGLDIKGVQHVIHYQIPKNSEVYVHRSGRTARIHNEGLSLLLISPDDLRAYEKIWKSLKKDKDPPDFPVDVEYLNEIRKRLSLARNIDKEEHRFRKKKSNNDWFLNNAKQAGLDVDEDLLEDLGDPHEQKARKLRLSRKKEELNALLDVPLVASGFHGKYPTKGGKLRTAALQLTKKPRETTGQEALDEVRTKTQAKKKKKS